jgi:nucleotide-binding universal stress UspA family protein
MRLFENILIDVDASAPAQPAVEAAVCLARLSGARLRVVDVTSPAQDVNLRGEPMAASLRTAREAEAGWAVRQKPAEALIEEVERFGHDLVIRSQARDRVGGDGVNRELFRRCPCAVWALGPAPMRERPRVVAAVDASSHDPIVDELNRKAIETALYLAGLGDGEVTILHAWHAPAVKKLSARASAPQLEASIAAAEARAAAELSRLAGPFGAAVQLLPGDAAEVIPKFVVAEGVDLVLVGVRGGTGVWQRLFGSTAERLLDAGLCSVLAVKAESQLAPG